MRIISDLNRRGFASIALAMLLVGCSPTTAPMSDAAKAKELLQKMLGEWQSGTKLGEIKKLSPPVYITEDLWRNGAILDEFSLADDSEVLGSNIRIQVKLKCSSKNGKVVERSVRYLVTTQPALTIAREEG